MHNVVMDATLLSSLMACPRMTNIGLLQSYVPKGGKANSLETGSIVHTILEFYYKALIAGKSRKDAIQIGFDAGMEYINGPAETNKYMIGDRECGLANTPEENDGQSIIGWKWCIQTMEEYFDYYRNDSYTPLEVEIVKQRIIYQDDEIRVLWKSKMDLRADFDTGIRPMDHKTMKQRRDVERTNNQFIGQCVMEGTRQMMVNKIGFQKSLKPSEKFSRELITFDPDVIDEWINVIVPYYAHMMAAYAEANNYPPNFTHCVNKYGKCRFYENICTASPNMREENIKIWFEKGKLWDPSNE